MQKWEYKVRVSGRSSFYAEQQAELNELGQEGWELVDFAAGVFKRPIESIGLDLIQGV